MPSPATDKSLPGQQRPAPRRLPASPPPFCSPRGSSRLAFPCLCICPPHVCAWFPLSGTVSPERPRPGLRAPLGVSFDALSLERSAWSTLSGTACHQLAVAGLTPFCFPSQCHQTSLRLCLSASLRFLRAAWPTGHVTPQHRAESGPEEACHAGLRKGTARTRITICEWLARSMCHLSPAGAL